MPVCFLKHTYCLPNHQCNIQPDKRFVWADLSVAHGSGGLKVLEGVYFQAATEFREIHQGCGTDMHIV
jgi:hypothetical protein